ncbi:MAG: hypothetical protein ABIP68_05935 [Ferruginibacter sp.]
MKQKRNKKIQGYGKKAKIWNHYAKPKKLNIIFFSLLSNGLWQQLFFTLPFGFTLHLFQISLRFFSKADWGFRTLE